MIRAWFSVIEPFTITSDPAPAKSWPGDMLIPSSVRLPLNVCVPVVTTLVALMLAPVAVNEPRIGPPEPTALDSVTAPMVPASSTTDGGTPARVAESTSPEIEIRSVEALPAVTNRTVLSVPLSASSTLPFTVIPAPVFSTVRVFPVLSQPL